ncbi:hypothetical protein E2C01_015198 [Portunus trituberculatus]|uniref:Uncharacterized protein n=1 Tax=Portunus trituberculatus TaxID=210409 RepID=A0A5B7DM67_PORTR|nr:hypothetical protein [Portunus trituberculatus]
MHVRTSRSAPSSTNTSLGRIRGWPLPTRQCTSVPDNKLWLREVSSVFSATETATSQMLHTSFPSLSLVTQNGLASARHLSFEHCRSCLMFLGFGKVFKAAIGLNAILKSSQRREGLPEKLKVNGATPINL